MAVIVIDIRIRRHVEAYVHSLLDDIEFYLHHFLVAFVFVNNGYAVVAAHLQFAAVVRNVELVVCIGQGSIDAVLIILDGIVIESFQPIALEE